MITYYDDMVLQENNISGCCKNKSLPVQYVEESLRKLGDAPTWTITMRQGSSGVFCAETVTTAWSEGILMLPYSDVQQTI